MKGFSPVLPHCAVGDWATKYWLSQLYIAAFLISETMQEEGMQENTIIKIIKESKCS